MVPKTSSLADTLRACADASPDWKGLLDEFIGRLIAAAAGAGAPKPGDAFPRLSLPDARGRYRTLPDLDAEGPVVISFVRGGWCPYCRHELKSWSDSMQDLTAAGGSLVVIGGVVGGRSTPLSQLVDDRTEVLFDVDHGAALALGLAIYPGPKIVDRYLEGGLDLADLYGSASGFLPIPATFVVDQQGIVRYTFVAADFRVRAEPDDVIDIVRGITGKH